MPLLGIALARQILSILLFTSPMLPPLAPAPLLRPYPLPLPLLLYSSLFLDALSFRLLRALLAFALICNELLCCLKYELLWYKKKAAENIIYQSAAFM
jgi:hypothetical protein